MSHKGIRLLIETTSKSLGDDIQFTYARNSDFNQIRDKRSNPYIQLDLLNYTASYAVNNVMNFSQVWNVTMLFHGLDTADSTQEEYAMILDDMDDLAQRFLVKLNFYTESSDGILLLAINQQPFIKRTTDILTGQLLTFQIQAQDNWDYCANGC